LSLQVVVGQKLPEILTLQKKSCRKTSRRFLCFGGLCHHRAMNTENTSLNGNENIELAGESRAAVAGLRSSHARTGKIARLPLAVRKELNQRMRDGQPGAKLLEWINGLPNVQSIVATEFQGRPIQKQNLSQWRKGGYQDSLRQEETRQEVRTILEEIKGLQEEAQDGPMTDQLAFYLAVQAALELKQLKSAPNEGERAKLWRELSTWLVALRRGDLEMERIRVQREKLGLSRKTKEEREAEFWKWAEVNINRDEFCRRRCYTAEEREAAIDKILGLTPQERGETVPEQATTPPLEQGATEVRRRCDGGATEV
jgi:hypothetical protein